ncbi:YqaJ viral recombinase family protein [Hungatella hathewayi]|uniref:YqaJ viral recombinase family nuclease n=1 Tax=Hungatella hathewayi TaxID=154046 RepID=UPI003D8124B9
MAGGEAAEKHLCGTGITVWCPERPLSPGVRAEVFEMAGSSTAQRARYKPLVLVETAELSRSEWLAYRRRGIGGSDVASIFGISPFRTARDLYFDKLDIASVEEDEGNWVAMEMGNLLEPLVAKIFAKKTGYKVYQIKKMFYHPLYHFMLADVDYFVELPDGTTAILEIKTTNYNARDHWWLDGMETVPAYYESQGRHYMAVTDIDRVFFCCLYGNNEEEVIIREIRRDYAYEEEMIFLEQEFWEKHVLAKSPPPYWERGDLIMESARRHFGAADPNATAVELNATMTAKLMRYLQLQEEKKNEEVHSKQIEKELQRLKGMLVAEMGTSCTAVCKRGEVSYTITYNPVRKTVIDKDGLLRLKLQHPDIYEQFVSVSESRRFNVKAASVNAA